MYEKMINKTWRIGKFSGRPLFFLLFNWLLVSLTHANNLDFTQENITLQVTNKPILEVFELIEKNSDFIFLYYDRLIDPELKVSVNSSNKTITETLDAIFQDTDLTYKINNRQISISRTEKATVPAEPVVSQQKQKLTGVVMDELNDPLPGVTIQIAGSTQGVITDLNGSFSIDVNPEDRLILNYLGYQEQIVSVKNENHLVIKMKPKIDELSEVTIVAFAKQKKESVIASVSTVKPSELKIPSSNLTTSLAGRVAGIISYQTSGEPGADNAQFFIRGITSFGSESKRDPLILIDNIESSSTDLARLQPDDIASFSIMKDATAAALYGSRGANGVILITTKQGEEGPVKVSVRYETSMSSATKQIELADPITYMRLHNEAVKTRNPLAVLPYTDSKIANTIAGVNPMVYPMTDWYGSMFKDYAVNHRFNFNLSGGGKVARYYLSGTYNQDTGVLNVDGKNNFNNNIKLNKYVIRANVNLDLTPTTEVVVRVHGTFDDYTGPIDSGNDLYKMVIQSNPVLFPAYYEADATHASARQILFGNYGDGGYRNPYAEMVKGYKDYSQSKMLAQIELRQKLDFITKGLSMRFLANTDRYSYFDVSRYYTPYYYTINSYNKLTDTYTLKSLNDGNEALDYFEGKKEIDSTYYMEAAVDYNTTFGKKHDISGLLVYTMRQYLKGNAGSLQLSLPSRNLNLAGRFTYGFDSRYFFEFNFGYNGSERFSKKERFGFFPSAGLGWMASNESFYSEEFKNILPVLKFKATYGLVGNDEIGDDKDRFFYLSEVNTNDSDRRSHFGSNWAYYTNGVSISRYANPYISWETAYKTNIGVEFNLLNKIEVQADYFREYRKNILMTRSDIPSTAGLQAIPQANIGEASGEGFEFSIDYNHMFNSNFWLTGRFNFTYATSKYKKYEETDYSSFAPWKLHVGQSLGQEWGYVAERLFVDEEEIRNSPTQNFSGDYPTMAGDIKYKDINGDGVIDELDMVPIGYPETPQIIYGFGFSAGYKSFDFSCFFQGSARSTFFIDTEKTQPFYERQNALIKAYADSHWSEENRDLYALWPRLSEGYVENNRQRSTWWMRDGSFLRLKSAEIGYALPQRISKKSGIAMLRVYLSGTNLLTFSKFKLWDPEMGGSGLGYPVQRVYNAGVQINF